MGQDDVDQFFGTMQASSRSVGYRIVRMHHASSVVDRENGASQGHGNTKIKGPRKTYTHFEG